MSEGEAAASAAVEHRSALQALAERHLWLDFTQHDAYAHGEVPIIVRGEGCYV